MLSNLLRRNLPYQKDEKENLESVEGIAQQNTPNSSPSMSLPNISDSKDEDRVESQNENEAQLSKKEGKMSDSLCDIAEEEPSPTSGPVRSFFSRNATGRLSNIWKKSVEGADEKIRGLLKKSISRSESKDSLDLDQNSPNLITPTDEFAQEELVPLNAEDAVTTEPVETAENQSKATCAPIPIPKSPKTEYVPTSNTGRFKVISGDPLGALDTTADIPAPTSSLASSVSSSTKESSPRKSDASDDSELLLMMGRTSRSTSRSPRKVSRSNTFTVSSSASSSRRSSLTNAQVASTGRRGSNSLWTLTSQSNSPLGMEAQNEGHRRLPSSDYTNSGVIANTSWSTFLR